MLGEDDSEDKVSLEQLKKLGNKKSNEHTIFIWL